MKKPIRKISITVFLLSASIIFFSYTGTAQVLMYETFNYSAGTLPPGWSVIGSGASSWGVYNNSSAGGAAPEMRMNWNPSFVGESRLMTHVLNSGAATTLKLSLNIFFQYYGLSHTIKIGYSTDNGATWTDFWQQVCTSNYGPKTDEHIFNIPANTDFRLGFYYSGDNYNIWDYNLDNVKVESVATPVPLSGIYYIPAGTPGYPTISAAIADLNLQGVGDGGVTFKIAANYSETFSSPTAGLITASGTLSDPVLFIKDGAGANPLITAGVGVSTTTDGIIIIAGGDYITFDGIDLQENSLNLNATTQMEWGYALVKASATAPFNGCQHITIKNCYITLNKANPASVGIYSGNHIASNITLLTITNVSDAMNNCKFYGNVISNVYRGITLIGFNAPSPYTLYDANNEIGVEGANIITNFGGAAGGTGLTPQVYGIYTWYSSNVQVANNTINGGDGTGTLLYGIRTSNGANGDVYNNTVTLNGGSTRTVYGIGSELGATGTTVNIHHNTIENCSLTTATTGLFYGIQNQIVSTLNFNVNIYENEIRNNLLSGTGNFIGIDGGYGGIIDIYNNSIHDNTKNNSGQIIMIRTGTSGTKYLIRNNIMYMNNIITTGAVTASSTINGFYSLGSPGEFFYNNQIYDCSIGGTSTGLSTIYGINAYSFSSLSKNFYGNNISNLAINSGSGTVYGILFGNVMAGNSYTLKNNKVYGLSAAGTSGAVTGIHISGGNGIHIYNNFISDLKAPDASGAIAINGMNIAGGSLVNAYYNTIYLNASSTATTFGSSGIYKSTTVNSDFRNNCVVNVSVPGSSGKTVAFRWSGTYNSSYYNALSNNNNWYAGTPGSANLIFYDGTNSDLTLTDFQVRVFPGESNSVTEMPPFTNVAIAPYDLHMMTSVPTLCDGGASPITTPIVITDDFDGDLRAATPDIGADEFDRLPVVHSLSLPEGWCGLSSYLIPMQPAMEEVFAPIMNELIIAQTMTGTYYPGQNINTIGNWVSHSAYKVKTNAACLLEISGDYETNLAVPLSAGWNLLPVVTPDSVDAAGLLLPVNGFVLAKDVAGTGVYWPQYNLNSIGYILPGKAYYVLMSTPGAVDFTGMKSIKTEILPGSTEPLPGYLIKSTPSTHTIAILPAALQVFEHGSQIGAFDQAGHCFGATVYNRETISLTVFGDDPTTAQKDGFYEGERMWLKDISEPETRSGLVADFDVSLPQSDGLFAENGLSAITGFNGSTGFPENSLLSNVNINPSPTEGMVYITGIIPGTIITVTDLYGKVLKGANTDSEYVEMDLTGYPSGIYFIKAQLKENRIFRKVVLK